MRRRTFCKTATIVGATAFSTVTSRASLATKVRERSSMSHQITTLSASRLSAAIRDRDISCREVMAAYLERIHKYNPTYKAIVILASDDTLLEQAHDADKALSNGEYCGWMHGMPQQFESYGRFQSRFSN